MRYILALFVVLAGWCSGAYVANDTQEVVSAGTGYSGSSPASASGAGDTSADILHPFTCAGTLSRVKVLLNGTGDFDAATFKIMVLRPDGSVGSPETFTAVGKVTVTTHANAVSVTSYFAYDTATDGPASLVDDTTGLPITVQAGDCLAIYSSDDIAIGAHDIGENSRWRGTGETLTLSDGSGTLSLSMQGYVTTKERVVLNDATGYANGGSVNIPFWTTQNQYICIEDVDVPDTEDLQIALYYTAAADGLQVVSYTVNLSYDGSGDDDNKIALFAGSVFSDTVSKSIAGGEGEKHDLYIHHDMAADKLELIFANVEDGTGGQGAADIQHVSITDRTPLAAGIDLSTLFLRKIVFTNAGTGATIGRITVCRDPIVMVGDSFCGSTNVGQFIAGAFTEDRYLINTGIAGGMMTSNATASSTSIVKRWDEADNDRDICAFRDVLFVLCNGPGLNDVATIDNTVATRYWITAGIVGGIGKMIADSQNTNAQYGGSRSNDIVISTLIPYIDSDTATTTETATIPILNKMIKSLCYYAQVPMADAYAGYDSSWYDAATDPHPDETGAEYIADKIAAAHESATIPTASQAGIGSGSSGSNGITGGSGIMN